MLKNFLSCLLSYFYVLEKFKIFNMLTLSLYVLKKKSKFQCACFPFVLILSKNKKMYLLSTFLKTYLIRETMSNSSARLIK